MLTVTRNDFHAGSKGVLAGPNCRVDVRNNTFSGHFWAINIPDNSSKPNNIRCNVFDGARFGTLAFGNNDRTVFLENDYYNMVTGGAETRITRTGPTAPLAKIFSPQGGPNNPADNCFDQNSGTDFLATSTNVEPFKYFFSNDAEPGSCLIPTVGNNNYTIASTPDLTTISCYYSAPNDLTGEPPYTKAKLTHLRNLLTAALIDWQTNPNDYSKGSYYFNLVEAKTYVMDWLLTVNISQANYTEAETLLSEENTQPSRQELLGLKASHGNWIGMSNDLSTYPVANQDDAWFVQIQQINLQRLSTTSQFILSTSQEALLYQVALSYSPIRGYARGLLALLKGERIMDEDPEDANSGQEERTTDNLTPQFSLFPNPANDVITVKYPYSIAPAQLILYDRFGRLVNTSFLDASGSIMLSIAGLPTGVYALSIEGDKSCLYLAKIAVSH